MHLPKNSGFVCTLAPLVIVGLGVRFLFYSTLFMIVIGWQGLRLLAPSHCCRVSCGVGYRWGRKRVNSLTLVRRRLPRHCFPARIIVLLCIGWVHICVPQDLQDVFALLRLWPGLRGPFLVRSLLLNNQLLHWILLRCLRPVTDCPPTSWLGDCLARICSLDWVGPLVRNSDTN